MNKRFILLLLISFIIGSCAPAPPLFTPSPTATVRPTKTPRPTQTDIPTVTPSPSLQTEGPYLLFTFDNQNFPLKNFTIMDSDGSGRKQFQLPNNGYISQLNKSVSPDGTWLAYFTGSIEEPYDITLNLLSLSDGTTQPISNLLAPDFPANLEPIVETMVLGDPPIYHIDCFEDMECRRSLVERELTNRLFSLEWSPDSQSIAFAAQIDGPSSDIYMYDIQDKTIRQLTNELQNTYSVYWSPNGQRILYEISFPPGNISEGREFHLVNVDGKEIPFTEESLYEYLHWYGYDWISENLYLLTKFSDTEPHFSDFKILYTETGQVRDVWPYTADYFAVNKETGTVVLIHRNHPIHGHTVPEGIYMVYPSGKYWKISDVGIQFVLMEGQKPYPIFAQDHNGQFYSVSNNGSIDALPWVNDRVPWVSPDGKLLLFSEDNNLALYTDSYQPIKSWPMEDHVYNITWRPDSLGLFIFTDINMYYLSVPDGERLHPLMNNCSPEQCEVPRFIWLP